MKAPRPRECRDPAWIPACAGMSGGSRRRTSFLSATKIPLRRPLFFDLGAVSGEAPLGDRSSRAGGEILVVEQIDDRQEGPAERLIGLEQMVQVSAGKIARRGTAALRIERARIVGMPCILDIDRAEAGKGEPMAAVARGQNAIEHIDAMADRIENIRRCADAHQIARALDR